MKVVLCTKEGSHREPIETGPIPVVPRVGETVAIMSPGITAKVQEVEYIFGGPEDVLVWVVLDRVPAPTS